MSFSAILRRSSLLLMRPAVSSLSPIHHYSSSAKRTSIDDTLLGHIEDEIQFASAAAYEHKCKEVPDNFPFKIKYCPRKPTILSRKYRSETINVTVSMPYEHSVEGDESVGESKLSIVVRISKKNWSYHLEFGCTAMPYQIYIDSIEMEMEIDYEGPDFWDLGENLQKALHKYLEIRGITASTMNFVREYMISKYEREYLMLLNNLESFVEA